MQAFKYTYLSFEEILQQTGSLRTMGTFEQGIILAIIVGIFFIIVFWIPLVLQRSDAYKFSQEKLYKKNLLKEILLKKEIEDEVEKEIQLETKKKT